MARIVSSERRRSLNTFLVELRETTLGWDYAAQNERVSVWIAAQSAGGEVALAYPAVGFGSDFPWGCVAVTADSCGMDAEWHSGLEDAAIHAGFLPTSRIVTDPASESFIVLAKAVDVSRDATASLVIVLGDLGNAASARPPSAVAEVLRLHDDLDVASARRVLNYWQLDAGLRQAIDDLNEGAA